MASEFETFDLSQPMADCLVGGIDGELMFVENHERVVIEARLDELRSLLRESCTIAELRSGSAVCVEVIEGRIAELEEQG